MCQLRPTAAKMARTPGRRIEPKRNPTTYFDLLRPKSNPAPIPGEVRDRGLRASYVMLRPASEVGIA